MSLNPKEHTILSMPTVSQTLVALFLVLPSFSVVSSAKNIPLNPIWFLLAILLSFILVFSDRGKNLVVHKIDILILSLILIDFTLFSFGVLTNYDIRTNLLGLYREVGIYVPYFFVRSVYIVKGKQFFFPVMRIVFIVYALAAIIGILQQFGLFSFEELTKAAFADYHRNVDNISNNEFLNRNGAGSATRSFSWLGSPLTYSQLMSTIAVLAGALFLSATQSKSKLISLILFSLMTLGMLCGLTRNYFLSLFLSTSTMLIYNYFINGMYVKFKFEGRKNILALTSFLVFFIAGFTTISPIIPSNNLDSYWGKLSNTTEDLVLNTISSKDKSTDDHLEDILEFPRQVIENPFGSGLGSFGVVAARFKDGEGHIEGVWYAQILQRGVFVQAIVFSLLFSIVFSIIRKSRGDLRRSLNKGTSPALYKFIILSTLGILVSTFASGFFLPDLYSLPNASLLFGLLAFNSSVLFSSAREIDVPTKQQMSDISA